MARRNSCLPPLPLLEDSFFPLVFGSVEVIVRADPVCMFTMLSVSPPAPVPTFDSVAVESSINMRGSSFKTNDGSTGGIALAENFVDLCISVEGIPTFTSMPELRCRPSCNNCADSLACAWLQL